MGAIPPNVKMGISLGEAQSQRNYSRSEWKPKEFKKVKLKKYSREIMVDVFNEINKFLIIIEIPNHTDKNIKCDINGNILTITSNISKFKENFKLPKNVLTESINKSFNNGIIKVSFLKK